MTEMPNLAFRRKHDFYYIVLLFYVLFGGVYLLITGTITDRTVRFGFKDPVVYIIGVFIIHAVGMLLLSIIRNERLILHPQKIVFKTRFRERAIYLAHITKILLKRERRKFNDGTFAVVKLKMTNRRRWVRIRVANYERESELYQEFKALKDELKK